MATRQRTPVNPPGDDDDGNKDDEFGGPDEFNIPLTDKPNGRGGNTINNEGQALSLEDLDAVGFNDEQDEAERKRLYPPPGDWVKSDEWEYKVINIEADQQPGDRSKLGRTIYLFYGKPEERYVKGEMVDPIQLNIRMSPDRRFKQDDPTKVDFMYAMFLKAKDLYLHINQEKVSKPSDLVKMMVEDRYVIRTMNGDGGPFVLEIKAVREQKK